MVENLRQRDRWKAAFIALCVGYIVLDFLMTHMLPTITGRVFPVTSLLHIEQVYPAPEHQQAQSRVVGTATKYWECNFVEIEWNFGQRGGRYAAGIFVEFLDPPEIRDNGLHRWERLYIGLSPEQVQFASFGDVWHDCGLPWLVRTPFYDAVRAS